MKKYPIIVLLILISLQAFAQDITGKWLIVKVDDGKNIKEPYMPLEFKKDGSFTFMNMPIGKWKISNKGKAINFNSKYDKDLNGAGQIISLNSEELIVKKDGKKYYYKNINQSKINKINSQSPVLGVWIFQNEGLSYNLKFEKPDTFVVVITGDGSTTKYNGNWIYSPKDKSLIMIGFFKELKGKSSIKSVNANELVLENKGKIFKAVKAGVSGNSKIERLNFKYEDFDEDNRAEDKLPWIDFEQMSDYLSNLKELVYNKNSLIEETNTFKKAKVIYKIKTTDKPSVKFTKIYIENGSKEQLGEYYKGGLSERYNNFFPRKSLDVFRIVGNKTVKTDAGSFDCTVIEGIEGDDKVKYFMINDKPGVYAKIIIEGEKAFGGLKYIVYELEKIVLK